MTAWSRRDRRRHREIMAKVNRVLSPPAILGTIFGIAPERLDR
jgi:hypothetical protein